MIIRPAVADDADLLTSMRLAFIAEHRSVSVDAFDSAFVDRTRSFVATGLADHTLPSWFAVDDGGAGSGDCVGAVSMLLVAVAPHPDHDSDLEGYVLNMYVRPDARHRGAGRSLLDACIEHAAALALRRVYLFVTAAGRPLYESAGFRPNGDWMELRPR